MDALGKLLEFLDRLESAKIYFTLFRARGEAIMVKVDVPGQRWEIEFFADGHVETEVFKSSGDMEGAESLARLLAEFSH